MDDNPGPIAIWLLVFALLIAALFFQGAVGQFAVN